MRPRLASALLLAAAACGPELAGPGLPGGPPAARKPAPLGQPVALVIGPGGGSLTVGDLTLTVPAGAVAQDTDFTIVALDPATVTAVGKVGTAYQVGPAVALLKPVTLTFAVAASTGLATSHQIALGYWLRSYDVALTPTSVSVTTRELGDWTLVTVATQSDLHGPFRIVSTLQDVNPITFTGSVTLQHLGEEPDATPGGFHYYLPVGTVTPSSAACAPAPALNLPWSLAEIHANDAYPEFRFRWAIVGQWTLTCGAAQHFVSTGFDTMGIYNSRCAFSYTAAMPVLVAPDHVSGQYLIDCGLRGTVTASWDLVLPGATPLDPGALPAP